jgi:hypothetical protein
MPRRILWVLFLSIGLFLSATLSLYGQNTYGSIAGAVTDASGASITDANVTLTNLGTSEKRTQSSGTDGLFTFVNLLPGTYRVDVEKQGFKHFVRNDVTVDVQQSTRVDTALQVGEVSQVVEVTSETPLLQTESSSLGTVVDQREANELPLNGRNIFNLTTITPSVIPQGSTEGNVVGKNPFDFANYQIGGAFANEGAEYLDGQPLNIGYINLPFLVPTQDSISEFKVQDNNLGPEWGKFAGGVINMATKSGTNTWHGEGYEYLRNKALNTNEFFNKVEELNAGTPNTPVPFVQNQFGAAIGGAIIKNKTFVFGSYEGFRLRQGTPFNTTVPTLQERQGDFSDLCLTGFNGAGLCNDGGGTVHQIYNPLTATSLTSTRSPFPFNCIADLTTYCQTNAPGVGNLINPTSAFLLNKLIADPTTNGTVLNFLQSGSTGGDTDEYVARADQTISSRQTLFGRFTYWKLLSLSQDPFKTGLCVDRCAEKTNSKSVALGYNFAISSNTIFNLNASISRFHYLRAPVNDNFDVTQEGWPAAYNALVPSIERTPLTPCFAQNDSLVSCSQGQSSIDDLNTQFNISPQVTMIRGHHNFVWGLQLEEGYDDYLQTNTGGGLISFAGSWTSAVPGTVGTGNVQGSGAGNGEDFADFLLGYGNGVGAAFGNQTTGSLVISGPISGKQTYRAFYFGDTWHATSKLTLNLGVRYELQGPWSERYNKQSYFNPSATNASVTGCGGVAGSACPGDVFLVGTGANTSRNNLPLSYKEVLPRLGFAYAADSKTVIRGGYGIFFIPNYVSFNANPYNDILNAATSNFYNTNNHGVSPAASLNANTCAEPTLGGGTLVCAGAGPFNQGTYVGGVPQVGANNITAVAGRNPQPNVSQYALTQNNFSDTGYTVQKYGYLEQYNFDIQRQLPAGFFADVAYAGSHGVHLEQSNTNINQIPDSFISQAASQYTAGGEAAVTVAQPFAGAYPFSQNLPGALGPGNLINGQLNRPYPQYSGLNLNAFGCCESSYNALQATVTRRFQGGGTVLVSYTNSKLMSNTDTLTSWLEGGTTGGVGAVQDWNNLAGERSLSSQDIPQRLVVSYVLDLPFGHGKKFLSNVNGFANAAVSGWGFDGISTFQRGFPVKVSWGGGDALTEAGLGTGTLRPDYVPGCDKSVGGSALHKEQTTWFNTACFTAPSGNFGGSDATPNNPWTFGNEPRVDATMRQQGVVNFDFAVFKRTTIMERLNMEFRAEFFDLFNHPQFGPPNSVETSSTFGAVTNTVNSTFRIVQFGLKFIF